MVARTFPVWQWRHSFSLNAKGRIWIAWKPSSREIQLLKQSEQFIHYHTTQLSTKKKLFITFVYGMNHEQQRHQLWQDLQSISQQMTAAWCIVGDFNSVLQREDRMGGNEITNLEVEGLADLMDICELEEMNWSGAYFSCTNKT